MGRFEEMLEGVIERACGKECPAGLAGAMRYAVFPGGARIRPRLLLAVSQACGDQTLRLATAAAVAVELLHCASLVHDDLPCFDDADLRRGKPSLHRTFGEPLAVLAGDALIVLAFETIGRAGAGKPSRLAPLLGIISRAVGGGGGIIAGQAWESEAEIDLVRYHQAKTGALFAGATMAGAAAAGVPSQPWRDLGERIGAAFQIADDIRDVVCTEDEIGKPNGQDTAFARPNLVHSIGLSGAVRRLEDLVAEAVAEVPACPGRADLQVQIRLHAASFLPKGVSRLAA